MSRTLHVIDQPGEVAEAAVLRLSVDSVRFDSNERDQQHAWLLFGGEATRDAARSVGLGDHQYRLLPRPMGLHKLLPAALAKPRRLMDQAPRVICWTEGATQIASLLGCANVVRRVDRAALCPFAKGIIRQAHHSASVGTIKPGRQARREQWGAEDDTVVVALLGDRFGSIDAGTAMMAVTLTHEALRPSQPDRADVRLLCHPLAQGRAEAAEFSGLLELDRLLMQDADLATPWMVLQSCDAAIVPSPDQAGLALLWAWVFGVPTITPADPRLAMLGLLGPPPPARSGKPRDLADTLTGWVRSREPAPASNAEVP